MFAVVYKGKHTRTHVYFWEGKALVAMIVITRSCITEDLGKYAESCDFQWLRDEDREQKQCWTSQVLI